MADTPNKISIYKIVYFDEGSVSDFITILADGKLERTKELLEISDTQKNISYETDAEVGIGGKLLKQLLGISIKAEGAIEKQIANSYSSAIKTIIKNTVLTDFLKILQEVSESFSGYQSPEKGAIRKFDDYKLTVVEGSSAFYIVKSLRSIVSNLIDAKKEDSAKKIIEDLRYAKGYIELLCVNSKNEKQAIMRFNAGCFRNGYTICDLLQMQLNIYAIKIGNSKLCDLAYKEYDTSEWQDGDKILDIYDVLFAGIESSINK